MDINSLLTFLEVMDGQQLCLSATCTRILFTVAQNPGILYSDLPNHVARDRSTISHSCAKLRSYNLIDIDHSPDKGKSCTLTPYGENVVLHILDTYYSRLRKTSCRDAHFNTGKDAL